MAAPPVFDLIAAHLRHRPVQSVILLLAVAIAAAAVFAGRVLEQGRLKALEQSLARLGADLVVVPRGLSQATEQAILTGQPATFTLPRSVEAKVQSIPGIERTATQLFLKSLTNAACCSASNLFLVAFDPESDFTVRPWLLDHPERPLGPDEILAGAAMIPEPGDTLRFYGHTFTLAGKLAATGSGLDLTIFIPREGALRMARESAQKAEAELKISPEEVSAILVRLQPEAEGGPPAWKAAYEIESRIPEVSVIQPDDLIARTRQNLSGLLTLLRGVGGSAWPAAVLLLGLTFALAVNEQKREIGILRALGGRREFIFRLVFCEVLALAIAGGILGLSLAGGILLGFSRLIAVRLHVPWLWPDLPALGLSAGLGLGLAVSAGGLAGLLPALSASRLEPAEAMRRGEL